MLQIFSRFTEFIPRYIWTEEVARFCFIWIIMLGSMIAVRDGTHFDLDVLPAPKTAPGKAIARIIVHVAMLLVALIFVVFGLRFALFGLDQESELTGSTCSRSTWRGRWRAFTWSVPAREDLDDIELLRGRPWERLRSR